jgi:hypothetical protein
MRAHTARTIADEVSRFFRLVMVGGGAAAEVVAAAETKKSPDFFLLPKQHHFGRRRDRPFHTYKRYVFYVSGKSPNLHRHALIKSRSKIIIGLTKNFKLQNN